MRSEMSPTHSYPLLEYNSNAYANFGTMTSDNRSNYTRSASAWKEKADGTQNEG